LSDPRAARGRERVANLIALRWSGALDVPLLHDAVAAALAVQAAGLARPDISILSEPFLAEVRGMKHRNLAVDLLQRLWKGEIRTRQKKNVVQARSFSEMLEQTIRRYQNRAIEGAQVIEELIGLAKDMRAANARGEQLGLTEDELAFYDALETNDSAVKVLGDATLRTIARELVDAVRKNVKIDWTLRTTCARSCACSSDASSASTDTRRTSRRRRLRRCSTRSCTW
jgi:type I site-specific restriction-modification system R (restriction) subunit